MQIIFVFFGAESYPPDDGDGRVGNLRTAHGAKKARQGPEKAFLLFFSSAVCNPLSRVIHCFNVSLSKMNRRNTRSTL